MTAAILGVLILFLAALFAYMLYSFTSSGQGGSAGSLSVPATEYAYSEAVATNGFRLHWLKTRPDNITLAAARQNVTLVKEYGVNGGFFYGEDLLSIAVVDGYPVGNPAGGYGSGSENAKYARGTLVWDGATGKLSVQVVSQAAELKVTDADRFWAQGGISMNLGSDESWEAVTEAEHVPFPDDARLRSALVYDRAGAVYLVVSSTKGTIADFRTAIVETVGEGSLVDGIFLDGDGSSQLRSKEKSLPGDNRPVAQMIQLVK
ncbi:hypothetical protein ACFO9Q_00505 [Paenibacillus sp. GCM10023252]|uniref:hypothetical protein n=1 Tax=Paenibacillus sp. GCM10023252 TaxID=3252649 RepID=UPI0036172C4C